ncbi:MULTISPECIES: FecCD family ABC transporter permease [Azospira]|mgnify:CR=1 FL=1|jgi:iron complex transport system permease protein|uniref:ABC-type Fe3+-siderophore transport system, permease component n=2 Tax=Azospira oryzae TaxID=146939 RepID=G8QFD3_AZOOP|nr:MULTISPECIES: iron ABC transporter permease [Azospira]AEV24943.1 ABC-type Fe3+-siderophore transport system, permease component [Azospira oryzae PS]MDK9692050.1 iron ABC transporter permease [Azospira sp.]RZT76717.1 iron complex transport system permease protein [Azospira oryzae]TLS18228.1 MAG: iron ABC transporter permease [Betaproteobacteria bacterium]
MPSRRRALIVIALLVLLAGVSLVVALAVGSISIPPGAVLQGLLGDAEAPGYAVVHNLRLPRALAAFACGGLLAVAGCLMQVLLRNPLADPYVLGISGGAGVGALVAILLGLSAFGINGLAFSGALAATFLVFGLAHGDGSWTQTRLLLTGVIVAAGCGALVALMLSLAPEHKLHGMLYWLMGDLSQATDARPPLLALAAALLLALPFARELNLLARGLATAQALGVAVVRLRRLVYVVASLATATAVTTAGSIGFVGLVVPHLVRLAVGNDQRLLLPASALAGGALLALADTLARTVAAPQQLPVGVLTALIGVPVFLFLLTRAPR